MYENIKSKLRAYRYCLVRIDRIRDTIAELQAKAEKVTSVYSHMPKSLGVGDSMAATVAKIADLEADAAAVRVPAGDAGVTGQNVRELLAPHVQLLINLLLHLGEKR